MPEAARLVLVLLFLGPAAAAGSENLADELIHSLQTAASYLKRAHQDFILDGFVGFRVLNVWIDEIVKNCATKPWMSLQYQKLEAIKRTTSNIMDQSMSSVMEKDFLYFTELKQIIEDNFWRTPSSWAETNPRLVYSDMNNTDCHSINMIRECTSYILIGSITHNLPPCSVPQHCRKFMTQPGCSGYILSHQLFYSMIASAKGCTDPLFVGDEISDYNNIFCANMMKVNQMIEELNFPFITRDLFAENIMFCAMVGFSNFLKPEWLRVMLSWQDPNAGCFGTIKDETTPSASKSTLELILGDSVFVSNMEYFTAPRESHRRVKRNEQIFKDGCFCHMTSVVVGALAQYLVNYCF